MKAARQLLGQWPNTKADQPTMYAGAIAAALSGYPPGIVAECIDPRVGLARKREFPPTVACVVEWCDERLRYHCNWASYVPRLPEPERPPPSPEMAEKVSALLGELGAWLRLGGEKSGARAPRYADKNPDDWRKSLPTNEAPAT